MRSLSEREAHALAATIHKNWLDDHRDEPSRQFLWAPELYGGLWTEDVSSAEPPYGDTVAATDLRLRFMRRFCFIQAENCLAYHGLVVDEDSQFELTKAIGATFQRASKTLLTMAEGDVVA